MIPPYTRKGITAERIAQVDSHFRAANYLSAAQLYLAENPLLRTPLQSEHIKPRLLGHWGTTPGLNLIYTHLNRLIQDTGASILQVVGVGHGAPSTLACLYLEGTLGKVYPQYGFGLDGLTRFVRSFSWPGGFPSHLTALTPGAIHEGGELGYALLHAYGAVFDNPELIAACVIGDGEAETGPLAASWQSAKFIDPRRDGAVLPILHLNGYKLSSPALLARMDERDLVAFLAAQGYQVKVVSGDQPLEVHHDLWQAMDWAHAQIRAIQSGARTAATVKAPASRFHWPLIVLRTPKGWTGPKELDGNAIEGTSRSHQIPLASPKTDPRQLAALASWLTSYRPDELFDDNGAPQPEVTANCPAGDVTMGRNRHANGGQCLVPLTLPAIEKYAVAIDTASGAGDAENTAILGTWMRDVFKANDEKRNFRLFCPDETSSNRLGAVFEATERTFEQPLVITDVALSPQGRVMEILSEHCCEGWLEGYLQTGRHGVFACYEAFISIIDSMMFQYAKWQKMALEIAWREPCASLNYLLTSHVWEQDHNGYSHQGPTFINALLTKKAAQTRIFFPPDANCLLVVMEECLQSHDRINLVVSSKKSMPQWLDIEAARAHCAAGAGVWAWAGYDETAEIPDMVLAGVGDVPMREIVAAAQLLRRHEPGLRVRVVNVVDLMCLDSTERYERALDDARFTALFSETAPVIMAFHGYPMVIHELIYRRPNAPRFHVHGYREEGTTTTPFEMTVLNGMSRYQLAIDALQRCRAPAYDIATAVQVFDDTLARHRQYIGEHGDDMPEVAEWRVEANR
jgi:xylulose-5-phosphate/fructose-6-phosphate phosphoketolase